MRDNFFFFVTYIVTRPIRLGTHRYDHYRLFPVHPNDTDPSVVSPFHVRQIRFATNCERKTKIRRNQSRSNVQNCLLLQPISPIHLQRLWFVQCGQVR